MPLINSVIQLIVKAKKNGSLLLQEADGTSYLFDCGRDEFIANETLHVRVDGLERSASADHPDRLFGVVVDSELNPRAVLSKPIAIEEQGMWNPLTQYGPTAANDCFPMHTDRVFRRLVFVFDEILDKKELIEVNREFDLADQVDPDRAKELFYQIVGKYPWMIDVYLFLGEIEESKERFNLAYKYYLMGCRTAELSLPDTDDYVLNYQEDGNRNYLSLLHSLGNIRLRLGDREGAVETFKRSYHISPQDPGGARNILMRLTGEKYPWTEKERSETSVDPYSVFFSYPDIPIRDGYDPDVRPDYDAWLKWESSYRKLLIFLSHTQYFNERKMDKDAIRHHLTFHEMVEGCIARNSPREFRREMVRLMVEGNSRHDAIHILSDMLLDRLKAMQKDAETGAEADGEAETEASGIGSGESI
ncbi:hypothetical protein JXA80_13075 [bacterium]|nr:hypothetical protein [candidate division CSSED10-310 bacterium]